VRRELHNQLQELKGNIRVFCRVRPALGEANSLFFPEPGKVMLNVGADNYPYNFDKVFQVATPQEEVFAEVQGLVQSALDGYKVCIFAYGQTGSGKTYTMQGTEEPSSWGVIPRALREILQGTERMRSNGWEWTLQASFLEIYNEGIRDLLRPASSSGSSAAAAHIIKHDDAWGTVVTNLTTASVGSMEQISQLMAKASRQRAVGSTNMNDTSSRSHSVFALYLTGKNSDKNAELHGALHLVDLAGSERLDKSGAVGDRLRETQNINRSLSALADVFLAKQEGRQHVPFRNSKLTHLMEPCLSGQGKTLMVVNVGPEDDNAAETLCSLRFAAQVSQCDTGGKPKQSKKALTADGSGGAGGGGSSASSFAPPSRAPTPLRPGASRGTGGPQNSASLSTRRR
jgi:kinesin family protein C1